MSLHTRLDLRQTQSLTITPQLQQAIRFLQLGNIELTTVIEQELERNPFLERVETSEDYRDPVPVEERRDADSLLIDRTDPHQDEIPLDVEIDNSWDEGSPFEGPSYDPESAAWSGIGSGGIDGDGRSFEETAIRAVTLREHLVEQLELDISDPVERFIGLALIDALDPSGRLTIDLQSLATDLNLPQERIETVLIRLKGFDPVGIFAQDLAECLMLQLQDRNRYDPAMAALVENLDLLVRRDFSALLEKCAVSKEDLQDMIAELRHLNPKPAQQFEGSAAELVIPDVLMRPSPDGGWILELNPEAFPRVLARNRYYARVKAMTRSKEEKTFLVDHYQNATWLVKALHQRAQTILKISSEIVRQQRLFFEQGISSLKPLMLRDIAASVEMHESTVSRATTQKYIATPCGIFELKYFFTTAISSAMVGGEAHSAESVRHRLRALIDAESVSEVLSDDTLVTLLRAEGIDIARRTIAKYREAMHIPSSVQRRREKMLRT